MNKNLLILCNSAYGTVVKEIASEMGCFENIAVLNDCYGVAEGESNYHEKSIGMLEDYERFVSQYSFAIAAFENSTDRLDWSDKLNNAGFVIATLISPKAHVSPSAQVEQGCIVEPLAGISANVSVGGCTIVKMGALINHNSIVAKGCTCESYSIINTGAYVQPMRSLEHYRVILSVEEDERIRKEYT